MGVLEARPFMRSPMQERRRDNERVDVSETASISTGIASRYATAIFGLSKDDGALAALDTDITALRTLLAESEDFRNMIASPVYSREEQAKAVGAVSEKMEFSAPVRNTLGLMASKRRLFVLPQLVDALSTLLAEEKGEVTAEVTAAQALSADQESKLVETLKSSVGKDVKINLSVDEALIGGLIVKVGSRMIDTSIRSKLAALQNTMKEVG